MCNLLTRSAVSAITLPPRTTLSRFAFKRIASTYSADEKRDLFHNSAARAYRVETV